MSWISIRCEQACALAVPAPLLCVLSLLLMTCTSDDYMWNISTVDLCTLSFFALFDSCRYEFPAAFRHEPRMQLIKVCNLRFLCVLPSRMQQFFEHPELFRLLQCTSLVLVFGYLAACQIMTVEWSAPWCTTWFPYLLNINVVHPLKKYCAKVLYHCEFDGLFLPAIAVAGSRHVIRIDDAHCK